MKLTNELRLSVEQEINYAVEHLPALTRLNLEFTGSLIDANQLLASGWGNLFENTPETEWMFGGNVYLYRSLMHNGGEYRVYLAVGETLGYRQGKEGLFSLKGEELNRARRGEIPRWTYYRWISIITTHQMSYMDDWEIRACPKHIIRQLRKDLTQACVKPPRSPMEDLRFQIEGYEPLELFGGNKNLSESDLMLRQFGTVLERTDDNNDSISRLFAILFKLLFVEKSEGEAFFKDVRAPDTALMIADFADSALFPEIALLAVKMLLAYDASAFICAEDEIETLTSLAARLFEADCPFCALAMIGFAEEMCHQAFELAEALLPTKLTLIKPLLNYLCRSTFKTQAEMHAALECFRILKTLPFEAEDEDEDEAAQLQLLEAVIEHFIQAKYAPDALGPKTDKVSAIARQHYQAWQETLPEKEQWKRHLPAAVAVPHAWQSYIACLNETPLLALKAYPEVLSQSTYHSLLFPIERVIQGLPPTLIWEGLFPNLSDEEMLKQLVTLANTPLTTLPARSLLLRECYAPPPYHSIHIQKETTAPDGLSFIVVSGTQDDEEQAWDVLNVFPFFPSENKDFHTNITGAIWEYFPWSDNSVSEALIELDDPAHTQLCALMPFYTEDKHYCCRGQRFNGRLCAFATKIEADTTERKTDQTITVTQGPLVEEEGHPVELHLSPEIYDHFDQDHYKEEFSRAGFNLCGRILSKRTLHAFGEEIACIQVACAQLPINLDLYINEALVGDELTIGTAVHVTGWLYVDFTNQVDSEKDLQETYPEGLPIHSDYLPGISGIPTYIRTKREPGEETLFDFLPPRYERYAKQYLLSCDGVEAVTICPKNHLSIAFLVKRHGVIRPYAFYVFKENDPPLEATFTDRDALLLYLKKKARGVELHWELRERHLNLLDPSPSTPTATATSSMPDDTMNTPSDISLILETHSIQNGKKVQFDKQLVNVGTVHHWHYDEAQDAPERSALNAARFKALEEILDAWKTLSDEAIADLLDETFTYSSYWVTESLDKEHYLDYICGKFKTIKTSKSAPKLQVAVIREALFPQAYAYALRLTQGEVQTLLVFSFHGDKIQSMTMTDPDLFSFDVLDPRACFFTPLKDENGEPTLFTAPDTNQTAGQEMTKGDFFKFAVEVAAAYLQKEDMAIQSVYPTEDDEYPNIVIETAQGKVYYKVIPTTASEETARYCEASHRFIDFCEKYQAKPRILHLNFYCLDNPSATPVYGGTCAVKLLIQRFGIN